MSNIVVPLIPVFIQFLKQFKALLLINKSMILLKHKKSGPIISTNVMSTIANATIFKCRRN